ncbi:hypothetical protein LV779_02080 [Streptomyces thinghirensis]|nr:hypothetical protein [Streptomyces thinghirensis]
MHHPQTLVGIELPTLRDTLAAEFPEAEFTVVSAARASTTATPPGSPRPSGRPGTPMSSSPSWATAPACSARGTSGEGCDAESPTPARRPAATPRRADRHPQTGRDGCCSRDAYALGRAVEEAAAIV